jgi:hypothetical protein
METYPVLKRNYNTIDPIIFSWAEENSLYLYKQYKDEETRSVSFADNVGNVRFQIWIDPLDDDGNIAVHVWKVKKRMWERKFAKPIVLTASVENLKEKLIKALEFVIIKEV